MEQLVVLSLLVTLATFSGSSARAAGTDTNDPCSFLTVDEVEAVTGKLAGPPFRTGSGDTKPRPNGRDCRYETPDRRIIRLSVEWDGGKEYIGMMKAMEAMVDTAGLSQLKLLDGTTAAGHWDKAALNGCCEFNALLGDRVVTVDVSGSNATLAQAASLADAAIRRLDQPLAVSGAAGIKAAQERAAQRPKPRNVCDLLTRADAEAIARVSLSQPPQGTDQSCHYTWLIKQPFPIKGQDSSFEFELELKVTWQEGFYELRTTAAAFGNATNMLGLPKMKGQDAPDQINGPWDAFSKSLAGISAVKGNVMVSVEGGPAKQDIQRAFVEKAILNLSK